ncbi:MAG: delta-60 repeat domain-containing protein [Bacteroidetes bacterium]|nr:delta-60 repeat domain-containing protein [Bacteroidota bacterium]
MGSILPLADGRLVVSGLMEFPGISGQPALAALEPVGSLAPDFAVTGLGGARLTPWQNGLFYVGTSSTVRRILPSGEMDPSFIGMNTDPMFSSGQGGDYHLYPDGRVLLTGSHGVDDPARGHVGLYSLIWFTNTGHYDTTRTPRDTNGAIYRIAPLPNGQFYCGGAFTTYEGVPAYGLVRVEADGTLDTTFNAHIAWGQPWALLPMPDGGVLVGGDFRFEAGTDTLRLMRFLPNGSLDPNFNTSHTFTSTYRTAANQLSMIFNIIQIGPDLFAVCGAFNRIDGNVHGGIAMFDSTGNLLENYFQGSGAGPGTYMGATGSAIHGIMPTGDGSDDYWIWGSYHGYDDGTTNDTLQRMVSRLHGLSTGVAEHVAPLPGGSLLIRPNPANTWAVFEYRIVEPVKDAYIRVAGIDGRELTRIPITAPEGQPVYDTRQVAKGAYTVELVNAGKTVEAGKLVVE